MAADAGGLDIVKAEKKAGKMKVRRMTEKVVHA